MGAKVTIDSATMVNKGLEVIEAHWLFSMPYNKIEVLIHPESIVHSMVQYVDKSVIAQLGNPDMRVPIQYSLSYPERLKLNVKELNFIDTPTLTFKKPDYDRYPALKLAFESGEIGGTMPTVFNAANEVAVAAFLSERIPFLAIEEIIERVLESHLVTDNPNIDEIMVADSWARTKAANLIL
jgi:1-deoxy-D-xylulose-5-phosphate reductoisomerase